MRTPWILVVGLLALGACASASHAVPANGCTAAHHDALDPLSGIHLLPGAPEPTYLTDPPTSGAHRVGIYPRGLVATPISRPVQVALLERGFVIVQYRSALGPDAARTLAALTTASPYVTVAPNPALPDPVMATAWLTDMRCGAAVAPTVRDLRAFIARRVGRGPEPTIAP